MQKGVLVTTPLASSQHKLPTKIVNVLYEDFQIPDRHVTYKISVYDQPHENGNKKFSHVVS